MVTLTIYWEQSSAYYNGGTDDRCYAVTQWDDLQDVTLHLSDREATGCSGRDPLHNADDPAPLARFAEVPLIEDNGYVVVFTSEKEASTTGASADDVLATLYVSRGSTGLAVPPGPIPTWETITPVPAANAGRTDCPSDWFAYEEPEARYSICYPAGYHVAAGNMAVNISTPSTPGVLADGITVVASWNARPSFSLIPSEENCAMIADSQLSPTGNRPVAATLAGGVLVPACLTGTHDSSVLQGNLRLARDGSERAGYIQFAVYFIAPDLTQVPPEGEAILRALSVNFQ